MNTEEGREKRFFSQDLDLVLVIHKKKEGTKVPSFPNPKIVLLCCVSPLSNPNLIQQSSTHPCKHEGWDLRSGVLFKD